MTTIKEQVAERLSTIGSAVREKVIENLVAKEVENRMQAVLKTLEKLAEQEKERAKIKPDQEVFDAEGKVIQTGFSKPKLEEKRKIDESIKKMNEALEFALENNDFKKLLELSK